MATPDAAGCEDGPSARRALDAELWRIAELAGSAIRGTADRRGGRLLLEETPRLDSADSLSSYRRCPEHLLLGGWYCGALVGLAAARLLHAGAATLAKVDVLFVEAGARRVGVGEALLDAVVEWASSSRAEGVDVVALPGDQPTKAFLEATGFLARELVLHRRLDSAR